MFCYHAGDVAQVGANNSVTEQLQNLQLSFSCMLADIQKLLDVNCDPAFFLGDIFETDEFKSCTTIEELLCQLRLDHVGSAPPSHFISGVEIPLVNSTRDLGVLITDTLSWSDHIHLITSKAYKMLGLIRRSFSNTLSVFNKKSLYVSLVKSHLLYCSVIWRPHLRKDIMLLERVQRRASKFLLNDYSSDYNLG